MISLVNIYEGWKKHLIASSATAGEKVVADSRVKVCVGCEFAEENWLSKFVDGVLAKDQLGSGIGCGICGCPVNQKALVLNEKCPKNKW